MVEQEQKTAATFIEVELDEKIDSTHSANQESTAGMVDSERVIAEEVKSGLNVYDSTKDGIRLVATYHFAWAALMVLGMVGVSIPTFITAIVGITEDPEALIATGILGIVAFVLLILATIYSVVGYGLWKRRQWARTSALAIAMLSLFAVPVGTVGGGLTIWYLLKERVARTFS